LLSSDVIVGPARLRPPALKRPARSGEARPTGENACRTYTHIASVTKNGPATVSGHSPKRFVSFSDHPALPTEMITPAYAKNQPTSHGPQPLVDSRNSAKRRLEHDERQHAGERDQQQLSWHGFLNTGVKTDGCRNISDPARPVDARLGQADGRQDRRDPTEPRCCDRGVAGVELSEQPAHRRADGEPDADAAPSTPIPRARFSRVVTSLTYAWATEMFPARHARR
jgi:hypothetical protein